jgi:hypothetical protein
MKTEIDMIPFFHISVGLVCIVPHNVCYSAGVRIRCRCLLVNVAAVFRLPPVGFCLLTAACLILTVLWACCLGCAAAGVHSVHPMGVRCCFVLPIVCWVICRWWVGWCMWAAAGWLQFMSCAVVLSIVRSAWYFYWVFFWLIDWFNYFAA